MPYDERAAAEIPAAPTSESAVTRKHDGLFRTRTTAILWETVRSMIDTSRGQGADQQVQPVDQQIVSEYADMIEAEMARYQKPKPSVEGLDVPPQKKRI
jgi:hypothetical protein